MINATQNPIPLNLLYLSTTECRVCQTLRPQVEALVKDHPPWSFTYVDLNQDPAARGQWLVFTVPTVLVLVDGKEVRRFSRYLHLEELAVIMERYRAIAM